MSLQDARDEFPNFLHEVRKTHETCGPNKLQWTQHAWLAEPDGRVLVDHAYHLETLVRDWHKIQLKIPIAGPLEHYKKSKAQYRARDIYTQNSSDCVRELFAKDFEIFGYDPSFDAPSESFMTSPVIFIQ